MEERKIETPEVHVMTFNNEIHYAVVHFKEEVFGIKSPNFPQLLMDIEESCNRRIEK